jgi:hypothetical protein
MRTQVDTTKKEKTIANNQQKKSGKDPAQRGFEDSLLQNDNQ